MNKGEIKKVEKMPYLAQDVINTLNARLEMSKNGHQAFPAAPFELNLTPEERKSIPTLKEYKQVLDEANNMLPITWDYLIARVNEIRKNNSER